LGLFKFLFPKGINDLDMNGLLKIILFSFLGFSSIKSQDTLFQCDPWEEYSIGPYLLQNNTWGQGDIANFSQCIFTTSDSVFGWNWGWPNIGNNVKAYPEIIFGKKPWSSSSTNNVLPIAINRVENFEVNFDIQTEANGNYNSAFEFWITEDSLSNENGITTEVMIWTSNNFLQPAGNQISIVYVDGYFYKMYRADFDNWVYYAFVSEIEQHYGNLKIHDFINYMVSTDHLNPNEFLGSFEFGNEIVHGNGQTIINQYSISLNETLGEIKSPNGILTSYYNLNDNYPNPFNLQTNINYRLQIDCLVNLTIYDMRGKVIRQLVNEVQNAGSKTVEWDALDNLGHPASAGVYLYSLEAWGVRQTKKMILLK
tara:strand:- start:78 stop:1184 length:1107 start_codon:yes stop_codon:yes gene_type:complete